MSSDPVCPTFRKIFIASVFGVCVFLIPNDVQSATSNSVTLQWAANQESDLAGYRIYYGTTKGNYGSPLDVGKTTAYEFANLESNKTYYFSVTAYDLLGNESPPSLEVTFVPIHTMASPAPGSTLTTSSATFQWNAASGVEEYYLGVGTSQAAVDHAPYGDLFAQSTETNTSQVISGIPLTGNPVYVRLWWRRGTSWTSTAHTYQTQVIPD